MPAILLRFLQPLLRFLPHLILVAGLAGGLWFYGHTRYAAGEASGNARAVAALRERDSAIAALAASQKASEGYARELAEIRSNPAPVRPVRLCAATKPVPLPPAAPRVDGPSAPAGELPGGPGGDSGPGPDIGADLAREAERADSLAAQLRALQEWIRTVQS